MAGRNYLLSTSSFRPMFTRIFKRTIHISSKRPHINMNNQNITMSELDCPSFFPCALSPEFKPEPNRYVLYLQYGCPFAQRANIMLHLKKLTSSIATVVLDPTKTPEGFQFTGRLGTMDKDPYYGFSHIRQLYWKVNPEHKGPYTVPVLWDTKLEKVVSNSSAEIMRMFHTCFEPLAQEDRSNANMIGGGLYPAPMREKIDEMSDWIQKDINACAYEIANTTDQKVYDAKIEVLFSALDKVEDILAKKSFLLGESITETDIRLFTSIIRFDVAYYSALRCSKKMIRYDYPNIHKWVRTLYWDESNMTHGAFKATTYFDHIKVLYSGWAPGHLILAGPEPAVLPLD